MANQTLSPEVVDVLNRSTITSKLVKLPPGLLDRKIYEAFKKAMGFIGGKWNTPKQGFVFTTDPQPKLSEMLGTGVAIDEKKLFQAYFTPEELAIDVALLADVAGQHVLEPSAGNGRLADACRSAGAKSVYCVELNPEHRDILIKKGYAVTIQDFLTKAFDQRFSRIVMNPPYTKGQDLKHLQHALKWLKPGGKLVAILPSSAYPKLPNLVGNYEDWNWRDVPAGAFKESGTEIATGILTVQN